MISIVGLGTAASAIAAKFEGISNYQVYYLNDKIEKTHKYNFKLEKYDTPEEYEQHIPDVRKTFKSLTERVQFFVTGASMSSNYCLGILEQIKDKEIDVFYIKPDTELLTGLPKLMENMVFGVLQEYARSGLLRSVTLVSNANLENTLTEIPIKTYYDTLNTSIFSTVHYLNYFEFTEPEIGQVSRPSEINRIRTIGMLNIKNLEEKWLFDLDMERDLCYYICINENRLATEGGLHRRIVDMLKKKPKNAFRRISYAIYETPLEDFGFCVAHTNAVQTQKTLDSLETE